jgi:hypothetical protein
VFAGLHDEDSKHSTPLQIYTFKKHFLLPKDADKTLQTEITIRLLSLFVERPAKRTSRLLEKLGAVAAQSA